MPEKITLEQIEAIGNTMVFKWSDGAEHLIPMERLRALSPSAENQGERDLLGNQYGGTPSKDYSSVRINRWEIVGNYALALFFNDGHRTGIYPFPYLREIGEKEAADSP